MLISTWLRWKLGFPNFLSLYDSKWVMTKSDCMRFGRQSWNSVHYSMKVICSVVVTDTEFSPSHSLLCIQLFFSTASPVDLESPNAWLWSYRGIWQTEEPLLEPPSHEPLRKKYLSYFFSIILQRFMFSRVSPSSRIFSASDTRLISLSILLLS